MSHVDIKQYSADRRVSLLRSAEVCDWLAISRPTLYRLIRTGELRPTYVGARLRFDASDIEAYLEERRQGAPAA